MTKHPNNAAAALTALALVLGAAGAGLIPATAALAQSAAKATVDAAKAAGQVGEQGDGYLGLVGAGAGPGVVAAVAEINAGRRVGYQDIAAKSGVTPGTAGQATALQLFQRLSPGQYYKPVGAGWTRK